MTTRWLRWVGGALGAAMTLLACSQPMAPRAELSLDRQAMVERLAHPAAADWSVGRLTNPEVEAERAKHPDQDNPLRHVQAITSTSASNAGKRVSSAPAYHWLKNVTYWVAEDGTLYSRDSAGTVSTYTGWATAGDTFPNSAVTLSPSGLRIYLESLQGRFYALYPDGTNITGSPVAMGGNVAGVTSAPAPWVDPFTSNDAGAVDYVYCVTHSGGLYKFTCALTNGAIAGVTAQSSWTLTRDATAGYTETYRSSPIVIGGKAVLGSYDAHATFVNNRGYLTYFNTVAGTTTYRIACSDPIATTPSVELDDTVTTPVIAFASEGASIGMFDLQAGDYIASPPLLLNGQGGNASSGKLSAYNYGSSGSVSSTTLTRTESVVVSGTAGSGTPADLDTTTFYSSYRYDATHPAAQFGYLKYRVTSDGFVAADGTLRAPTKSEIGMDCQFSSNAQGNVNPTPANLRCFQCNTFLTTGTAWTAANMTSATRPQLPDLTTPLATSAYQTAHTAYETLTNAGNQYKATGATNWYYWDATNVISALDGDNAFVFIASDRDAVNPADNNGQNSREGSPRFYPATQVLRFTLSAEALSSAALSNVVSIDSTARLVYVMSCNALWALSYASSSTDSVFSATTFNLRKNAFTDKTKIYYCQTGGNSPVNTTPNPDAYVDNVTSVMHTGTAIYAMDNHPSSNTTYLVKFSTALPPAVLDSKLLTGGGTGQATDAKIGGTYMTYDFNSSTLFGVTYDASDATKGRLWTFQ